MKININFETAKLLTQKGFDVISTHCYAEERLINKDTGGDIFTGMFRLCKKSKYHKKYYHAPTIAEVVIWLYEKHGIWIRVDIDWNGDFWAQIKSNTFNCLTVKKWLAIDMLAPYKTPSEAYEAGINYCLKKLL